jgi:hypothetical protein
METAEKRKHEDREYAISRVVFLLRWWLGIPALAISISGLIIIIVSALLGSSYTTVYIERYGKAVFSYDEEYIGVRPVLAWASFLCINITLIVLTYLQRWILRKSFFVASPKPRDLPLLLGALPAVVLIGLSFYDVYLFQFDAVWFVILVNLCFTAPLASQLWTQWRWLKSVLPDLDTPQRNARMGFIAIGILCLSFHPLPALLIYPIILLVSGMPVYDWFTGSDEKPKRESEA